MRFLETDAMKKISPLKKYKTILIPTFTFLLGLMFAVSITPLDRSCRIDITDREYNIMQNSKLKNPELIILILSAPKNLDKRNTLRQTWLQWSLKEQEIVGSDLQIKTKHYFAIGSFGLSVDDLLHLSTEQSQYNDILILPIRDSYENLTLKVVKSFEWLNEQSNFGLGFKYVLKCDDDSFVHLNHLVHEIKHIDLMYLKSDLKQVISMTKDISSPYVRTNVQINSDEQQNKLQLYWGYFNGKSKVRKTGKWKENSWIACDNYVPYALGGGYIVSKNLVTYIAQNVNFLRFFNSEDISVGLWLQGVNNILRIHDVRFDTEWTSRGCKNTNLITHNILPKLMVDMFQLFKKNNILCDKETEKRKFYYYNWTVPPSQCCKIK